MENTEKKSLMSSVENVFFRLSLFMENSRIFISIKQGFVITMPVFIIGAFALLLLNIPIAEVDTFITEVFNGSLRTLLEGIYNCTFGLVSLYVLIAVTYIYSLNYTKHRSYTNIIVCIIAIIVYFILMGIRFDNIGQEDYSPLEQLNQSNVFMALLTSYLTTKVFFLFSKIKFRKEKYGLNATTDFRSSLIALLPMIFTILSFSIVSLFVKYVTPYSSFNDLIVSMIAFPFTYLGRTLLAIIAITFGQSILWFFGIHGSNALLTVSEKLFLDVESLDLFGEILTQTTFDTFGLIGGCGTAICLLIAILIFSRSKNSRSVAKKAAFPMAFNINEIMVFGLPIVLNPILLIPFILAPIIGIVIAYFSMSLGLVPIVSSSVDWTTPVFFSGYMATNSIEGIFLQIFNIAVGVLIYAPFVILNDRVQVRVFKANIDRLTEQVVECEHEGTTPSFFSQTNTLSKTSYEIAGNLREAIRNNQIEIHYQPLINSKGDVISCEALLRWGNAGEYLYPPLVISIAKEDSTFDALSKYIIEKVLTDIKEFEKTKPDITISINIQAYQIIDRAFVQWIISEIEKHSVNPKMVCLELTEETELKEGAALRENFAALKESGIRIAIDDFSMGHTSLNYLKNNQFDFLKLDGNLIKHLVENQRIKEIVDSVIALGHSLGYYVIAEYVETKEQRKILQDMGCNIYQGFLFSKSLPIDECIRFINEYKCGKTP